MSITPSPLKVLTPTSEVHTPSTIYSTPQSTKSSKSYKSSKSTPSFSMKTNSIGSLWTVSISQFKKSGTYFEAIQALREIQFLLGDVDYKDRIKFCKLDFDNAVAYLKRKQRIWTVDLLKEIYVTTITYFDTSCFRKLPYELILEIFLWLPISELSVIPCVSTEWHKLATSNELWGQFYKQKFLINNPGSFPSFTLSLYQCFRQRFECPHMGDKVEVAWKGKFRLETQDVYQGLAWWVAEIVDVHQANDSYKIHYPGWESRWDEWVPRARLRWAVSPNKLVNILVGDVVEIWCCGTNVPGAWLESKVKRIKNGKYCLGKVLSSGYLWVERDRLRLVRRGARNRGFDRRDSDDDSIQEFALSNAFSSISSRLNPVQYISSARCSIM